MEETTFAADPMRLMIAAAVGIVVLLVLIITIDFGHSRERCWKDTTGNCASGRIGIHVWRNFGGKRRSPENSRDIDR